jgi:hypothetical protein
MSRFHELSVCFDFYFSLGLGLSEVRLLGLFFSGITSWGVSISFKSLPNSTEASTLVKLLYIDDSKVAAERYLGTFDAHSVELCKDNMSRIEQKQGNPDTVVGFYRPHSNVDKTPCSSVC